MRQEGGSWVPRVLPSPGALISLMGLLAALGPGVPAMFRADGDVGRHVRVGREILAQHAIPRVDSLSFTLPGGTWVPKEWAAQVVMAAADRWAGLAGVAVLASILFAVSVWFVYRIGRSGGAGVAPALCMTVIGMLLLLVHLLPRPHLVTTVLLALVTWALVHGRSRQSVRPVLALPLVFLVWANMHAGFPIGLVVLGIFVADALVGAWRGDLDAGWTRWIVAIFVLSLLATLVNPVGFGLWIHVVELLSSRFFMSVVLEFQSPDFQQVYGRLLLLTILVSAALVGWRRPRIHRYEGALFLLGLASALTSARHVTVFAVTAVPMIGIWISRAISDAASLGSNAGVTLAARDASLERTERVAGPVLPLLVATVAIALALGPYRDRARFSPVQFPVRALESVPPDRMPSELFHQNNWGGYILYSYPDVRIFLDGHLDYFGEALVREYLGIRNLSPGWERQLDRYGINWALTMPTAPISQALDLSRDWDRIYEDEIAVVHVRISATVKPGTGS